jgi:TrpR family trp operon transcriptional repressor
MSSISELITVFCRIRRPEQMRRFLEEILTPAERHDLAMRWELLRMLDKKVPQRDIADRLGLSLCKITRGAKILKKTDSVVNQMLKKR